MALHATHRTSGRVLEGPDLPRTRPVTTRAVGSQPLSVRILVGMTPYTVQPPLVLRECAVTHGDRADGSSPMLHMARSAAIDRGMKGGGLPPNEPLLGRMALDA